MLDIATIQAGLALAKQFLGKDFTPEVTMFFRTRTAIGAAVDKEGQEFFMKRWKDLPAFLESTEGKKQVANLITAWQLSELPATPATSESTQ